jgi:hypothetical protein
VVISGIFSLSLSLLSLSVFRHADHEPVRRRLLHLLQALGLAAGYLRAGLVPYDYSNMSYSWR